MENTITVSPAYAPGQKVRLLDDQDKNRTFTVVEVNPVGKTGKQFRCALVCDQDGTTLTGIAPSRLASPYVTKGPVIYRFPNGVEFQPEVPSVLRTDHHPAMHLSGLIAAPLRGLLFDLIVEAAEKDTAKAHLAVVMLALGELQVPEPPAGPRTFFDRLTYKPPVPDPRPALWLKVALFHRALFQSK